VFFWGEGFGERASSYDAFGFVVEGAVQFELPCFVVLVSPDVFFDAEFVEDGFPGQDCAEGGLGDVCAEGVLDGDFLIGPELF